MTTIFKFPIELNGLQIVSMPEGAQILTAQMQGDQLCLWATVNPHAPAEPRIIRVFGTGHQIVGKTVKYIATVQHSGYVWHIFEDIK